MNQAKRSKLSLDPKWRKMTNLQFSGLFSDHLPEFLDAIVQGLIDHEISECIPNSVMD